MSQDFISLQKQFVNYRLGQFIHFSSATQQFYNRPDVIDWEFEHENDGIPRAYPFDPADWAPEKLDCRQWAEISKAMGARFAALTTKHHEGFCLWPTKTTEHCVRNAAVKTDVVKEYLEAYRSQGIAAGLYFSMLDLTAGIGKRGCTKEQLEYTKEQLYELLTQYGKIPFLIIDGWEAEWGGPSYGDMPFEEIDAFVKKLQPECLLTNHSCEVSLAHSDIVVYENAAGQEVPDSFQGPGCAGNILTKQWFWKETDSTAELKSAKWALDKIYAMNDHNVSFLINMSPNRLGLVDDNLAERLREIGSRVQLREALEEVPKQWMYRSKNK